MPAIRILLITLVFVVSACATRHHERESGLLPPAASQALYRVKEWRLEGRVGVKTSESSGWNANLFWEHEPNQDRLRITGPLGQGMVSIVVQRDLIYINEGDGLTELSHDPETALKQRLGFAVPLASLRFWILGLPDPGQPFTPLYGDNGVTKGFRQIGWTISPQQVTSVDNFVLPQRMNVQGSGVRLRIISDHWLIKG